MCNRMTALSLIETNKSMDVAIATENFANDDTLDMMALQDGLDEFKGSTLQITNKIKQLEEEKKALQQKFLQQEHLGTCYTQSKSIFRFLLTASEMNKTFHSNVLYKEITEPSRGQNHNYSISTLSLSSLSDSSTK
jgi:hypothetical protein